MRAAVQRRFFSYVWLLPVLLPFTQAGGRAAYLSLTGIYILWGLAACYRAPVKLHRSSWVALLLWGLLLCTALFSATQAVDSWRALDKWLTFALQMLVFPLTLLALSYKENSVQRLTGWLGLGGIVAVTALYLRLPYDASVADFAPEFYLREDNLPWLLPFILAWVLSVDRGNTGALRYSLLALSLSSVLGYIYFSDGRAALLGVTLSLAVYVLIGRGWTMARAGLCALLIFVVGLIAQGGRFLRAALEHPDMYSALSAFSSFRSVLWQRALENPPDSLWWGIGMGNLRYETELMRVADLQLGHLHNFLLDAGYEIGLIGLTALLLFIVYPLLMLSWHWASLNIEQRRLAGLYLAALAALLAAGLFSFSYSSRQFAMYLPLLLAAVLHLVLRQ
jgi:O-antigen ligase